MRVYNISSSLFSLCMEEQKHYKKQVLLLTWRVFNAWSVFKSSLLKMLEALNLKVRQNELVFVSLSLTVSQLHVCACVCRFACSFS